ncbi:hypothetical protein [Confluentibacter flavum]|uniref:Uncharacterized protein n=1 Tax=Confluentibacter flavum TaxID=1909700 RepID=A0A2N3HF34_9FLAO|nr:hypothetical protein [Confluentibacter flavum]PKQ43512.1 hypothetical protein CSW08_17725 [Confluentibacter flavum]
MKLTRRFYDSSVNFRSIPNERLVLSLAIGLASAFTIYAFFYVLRESFRIVSFGFGIFPNILSESDRSFYNLFFAGLSLIFANSIALNLIISKPQNILSRVNPKRRRILNEQIFLNFNFSYWFAKIGLVFGVFSMCGMDFDFLPYFMPFSLLLLVVLYLESWKTLSMVFKKNRFKFQLLHFLVFLLLTFCLSRLNIINYKAIDELSLKYNPIIDLPYSNFSNDEWREFSYEIGFKLKMGENNDLEIFTDDKKKINFNDFVNYVSKERASLREELMSFLTVRISADRDINLKYVKMLEAELYMLNINRVVYNVHNDDLLSARYEIKGISKKITKSVLDYKVNLEIPYPPRPPVEPENISFIDTLKISFNDQIKINGLVIPNNKLVGYFKNHISKKTLFLYFFETDTNYQDYITVLASHFMAASELRKHEQTIFRDYEWKYDKLYRDEQYKLVEKYPMIILEKLN